MYRFAFVFTCVVVSVASDYDCDYPSFYDDSMEDYPGFDNAPFSPIRGPSTTKEPPRITTQEPSTTIRVTTEAAPPSSHVHVHVHRPPTPRPNPPSLRPVTTDAPTSTEPPRPSPPLLDPVTTDEPTSTEPPRPSPPRLHPVTTDEPTITEPARPSPPRLNAVITDVPPLVSVISRLGGDLNSIQQAQVKELNCLEVLDNLITSQWQEDIGKLTVTDLGNFSTVINIPPFADYYSNPESEWIQEKEGMALPKLDKCVRNLVSKTAPRMNEEEIACLNKMYPEYLSRESKTAIAMQKYINDSYRDDLPFRSVYTYLEMTDVLFNNVNFQALDTELQAVDEDMRDFYIKTEEDTTKKLFIVEQDCLWKNTRVLREASNEDDRYRKFGQLVKSLVNRYLFSEILRNWVPGTIIPESRYDLWSKARETMEREILDKVREMQQQKRDAQFLCTYAAEFATKFFEDQKTILFENMKTASLSSGLKTHEKYSYVVALEDVLSKRNDNRRFHAQVLAKEFKEGHYCLTNFVRMVENHQRYATAFAFLNEMPTYGITYCQVKEMSAKLVNPRYCKCQGTFCEQFGLATIRAERYELILLPNGTYTVRTNPSYRVLSLDELVANANNQIAKQKFNTWWYRNQKMPPKLIV